jgi:hypothetical protein
MKHLQQNRFFFLVLAGILGCGVELFAQIPTAAAPTTPSFAMPGLTPGPSTPGYPATPPPTTPSTPATVAPITAPLPGDPTPAPTSSVASRSALFISGLGTGSSIIPFDPFVDNHLKAPADVQGLFGRPIKEVEEILRSYGAKPYSYAFGKHSRMTFSVYLVTLAFDRDRNLGKIVVDPKPPFSKIEPQAQMFFMNLFLDNADKSLFRTILARASMEISFAGKNAKNGGGPEKNKKVEIKVGP